MSQNKDTTSKNTLHQKVKKMMMKRKMKKKMTMKGVFLAV